MGNNWSCSKLLLDGLDKLEILEFRSRICDARSFSKSISLRSIRVVVDHKLSKLEDVPEIIRHMSNFIHLRSAVLELFTYENWGLTILEEIFSCKNLEKLKISSFIFRQLPNYQPHFFPKLTELTLRDTGLEEDPMGTLERLPNLRKLELWYSAFVGREIICHAMGFPQLETLELSGLRNLQEWKVEEGSMPKLSFLEINSCPRFHMVPDELRSRTNLKLDWDDELESSASASTE